MIDQNKDILEALESDFPVDSDDQLGAAIIIRAMGEEIKKLRTDARRMSELVSRARNWQVTRTAQDEGADMPASEAWEAFEIVHALATMAVKQP